MSTATPPPLDPSVAAYYDTRIKLATNPDQLAALNAAKQSAMQTYATANTNYTQDLFKIISLGPQGVDVDPELSAARDYLLKNDYLQDVAANTGEGNTPERYALGINAPHNFAIYSGPGDTPVNELLRLVNVNQAKGNDQTLRDSNAIAHTQLWGDMTYQGNIVQPSSGWDTFWKVAPMLPALFATIVSGGTLSPMMQLMMTAFKQGATYDMNRMSKPGT